MKISSNFIRFHNELGLKKTIDVFADAGYEGIDFNADLPEYYSDEHSPDFYKSIREYANERGIVFAQTHAPFASSFVDEEQNKIRFNEIVTSMKHSMYLGADMIVVHPCGHLKCMEDNNFDYMMEYNYNFYKKLIPYAREYNIKIAIENILGYVTQSPKGLLDLINMLNDDVFTVCYDVGHANISGQDPVDMILKLGKNIGCTHIHDNDGVHDSHTLPFYGVIDWEGVMKAFADVGYEGNLNYESGYFVSKVPVSLRAESAKYMAGVGKYLVERFLFYKENK